MAGTNELKVILLRGIMLVPMLCWEVNRIQNNAPDPHPLTYCCHRRVLAEAEITSRPSVKATTAEEYTWSIEKVIVTWLRTKFAPKNGKLKSWPWPAMSHSRNVPSEVATMVGGKPPNVATSGGGCGGGAPRPNGWLTPHIMLKSRC